jgi:hypothetical protein
MMATEVKPFLIRHADGREYELAGDAAGKRFYREHYQPQGFALVDPQPTGYERPDLSEPKPKVEKAADKEPAQDDKPEPKPRKAGQDLD